MAHDPLTYSADQVRRLDHDRYLCALFAPSADQARLFALYAFNLEVARVREVVSEPVIGQMRLQWWRDALAEMTAGTVRAHPVAQALARAMEGRPVRAELFERLLTAREFDLGDEPPADMAALEAYAADTSSALLQAGLDLLGIADASANEAARHIGLAWSLVGLLRAVPFHARRRRLYLPADLLAGANIDREQLFEGRPGESLRQITRHLAERAAEHLARARATRGAVLRAARPVLLPGILADVHLRRLARAGYDPFAPVLRRPVGGAALRLSWAAVRNRY
ncbi:MAG TPA: phytoene/squalene synthase family protein [Alphaproteobacteria bacterium]|nr:phytoene/squalene synthase family protein [Alphaproteobacteria bacterium]